MAKIDNFIIFSLVMVLFGAVEIMAAFYFTNRFLTGNGYFYMILFFDLLIVISGIILLVRRRITAIIAILLLIADIVGRVYLIVDHQYPFTAIGPGIAMITGTIVAAIFIFYLLLHLEEQRK